MSLSRGKSSAMLERLTASLARELAHDGGDPSSHRPWPLPRAPWVMAQTWEDLVFLHWPMDPDDLRARLPRGLSLDTYRGDAWVSITPFVVTGLRPRGIPAVPGLSSFAETNVRTYVTRDGKPGVWFFSLDASSRLAVTAARALYHLPYHHAEFTATPVSVAIVTRPRAGWPSSMGPSVPGRPPHPERCRGGSPSGTACTRVVEGISTAPRSITSHGRSRTPRHTSRTTRCWMGWLQASARPSASGGPWFSSHSG